MSTRNNYAVILTALPAEYQAVRAHLGDIQEEEYKGTVYEYGFFHATGQSWRIGIAQIGMGNSGAAAEAERAIAHFQPSVVMFVGIAGGLKDVQIGDVVVANKIYGYESGKANTIFEPRPELDKPSHALLQRAMAESRKSDWREKLKALPAERVPRAYVGPIAAGEKVIASRRSEAFQFLQAHYGDALAVEMEGYGFLRALYANPHVHALVIRGISDLITNKSAADASGSQELAAQHASAFAFEILAKFQRKRNSAPEKKLYSPAKPRGGKDTTMTHSSKTHVLAIFANPLGTYQLRLDMEERSIRSAIELSKLRENIVLHTRPAATIRDVSRALLNETYQIVHIAGHGSGQGLILANEMGGYFLVNQPTLADLFQEYSSNIKCVILNSCYSFTQGSLLSQHIPYTIAMDYTLNDKAAIKFSEGFYDAIAAGKDIDFAYREGKRRISFELPTTPVLPQLIKQGEAQPEHQVQRNQEAPVEAIEPIRLAHTKALVGVALDLSASMKKSFLNQSGSQISRLEEIRRVFKDLTQAARRGIQETSADDTATAIDMFIYGFGLQTMDTCDLLSLWKASQQVLTRSTIDEFAQQYKQEQQNKYSGYRGLGNFVRDLGLGNTLDRFEDIVRYAGEARLRKRIWNEKKEAIVSQAAAIGDTTLSLDEIATWWSESRDLLSNAEDLLFGKTTPIAEVLTKIIDRFDKELQVRERGTQPILFLISDGKYTANNPLPLAEKLRAMGVTILSCLITDKDVAEPRQLLHRPSNEWSSEAQLMFDMASPLQEGTSIETFLLHKGWTIYPQPKLFVQINHSEIFKEFSRITLSQFETTPDESLPRGW